MITRDMADALRAPFPADRVGKLPKIFCGACSKVAKDRRSCEQHGHERKVCRTCKANITTAHLHVDYVGHADVTDRLLSVDPEWTWEPFALDAEGLPAMRDGGLWIRLTVAGVTRVGFGDAGGKTGGDAIKEAIGDCLIAGTPIRTADGWQPIESVQVGQYVPTRQGWRAVTDCWLSALSAPVAAVLLDDGRFLVATRHHKVPTARGVSSVGALRNGDILYAWQDTGSPQALKTCTGTAAGTAAYQAIATATGASTTWPPRPPAATCTGTSTLLPTGQSRTAGTSTIATTILATTTPATSSSCPRPNTPSTTTLNGSRGHIAAIAAAESTGQRNTPGISAGVALGAKRRHGARPTWFHAAPAPPSHPSAASAPSAVPSSRAPSHGRPTVGPRVVAVLDAGTAPVWNLSVEDVHEYVANGLFVHNSIRNAAMRYGVALDLWRKERAGDGDAVPNAKAKEGSTEIVGLVNSIIAVGRSRGFSVKEEIEADFTEWSHHGQSIREATAADLAEYLGVLKRRPEVTR